LRKELRVKPLLVLLLAAAVLSAASPARAQWGINLFVDECGAGTTQASVTNACTLNSGTAFTLVGSAVIPELTRVGFIGCMSTLDVAPSDWVVPDWWRLDACRAVGFIASDGATVTSACPSIWENGLPATTMINGFPIYGGAHMRLYIGSVLAIENAYDFTGDGATELGVFRLTVTHRKTLGDGACTGCTTGAVVVLQEINLQTLTDTPDTFLRLTNPLVNTSVSYNGGQGVPARNRTWGAIKALYR
jgi:hypothetical protein